MPAKTWSRPRVVKSPLFDNLLHLAPFESFLSSVRNWIISPSLARSSAQPRCHVLSGSLFLTLTPTQPTSKPASHNSSLPPRISETSQDEYKSIRGCCRVLVCLQVRCHPLRYDCAPPSTRHLSKSSRKTKENLFVIIRSEFSIRMGIQRRYGEETVVRVCDG
jgi:hypothetical protein